MPSATPRPPATALRRAFVDISRGYSVGRLPDGQSVYIKHLSHREHLDYDDLQTSFEDAARKVGTLTEAQKLAQLKQRGQWSEDKELGIARQRDAIARFEAGRQSIGVPSILRNHDAQTERERETLHKMLIERVNALGTTVESYAQRRLEDYYIVNNLFADKDMRTLRYDWDMFDDLHDDEVGKLHDTYRAAIEPCSDANMRWLAVQDFFYSYFSLCDGDMASFFGHPICELSYYQARLGNVARYFKSLLEHTDLARLTPETRNDPDAIERMHIVQKNTVAAQEEGKLPSGLSPQDVKEMGLDGQYAKQPDRELSGIELAKHYMKQNQMHAAAAAKRG